MPPIFGSFIGSRWLPVSPPLFRRKASSASRNILKIQDYMANAEISGLPAVAKSRNNSRNVAGAVIVHLAGRPGFCPAPPADGGRKAGRLARVTEAAICAAGFGFVAVLAHGWFGVVSYLVAAIR